MNNLPNEADAADQLSALADQLHAVWHRASRGLSSRPELHGLQRQQYWVLGALKHGPRRMSDLAGCARTSQASLTGIVDRMEEHGLVERRRSSDDRRVVEVAATDAGRAVLVAAHEVMTEGIAALVEPLTSAERAELLRLLGKVSSSGCGATTE